jgi:hypothetical protein
MMLGVAVVAGGGCGFAGGRLPMVPVESESPGFKMLAPGAEARICGGIVWPYGSRSGGALLERALAELVGPYGEADVVRDLQLSWRGVDLVVAQIGCVSVRGDVGRNIPTVSLPMLGEHGEHMHHGTGASP